MDFMVEKGHGFRGTACSFLAVQNGVFFKNNFT